MELYLAPLPKKRKARPAINWSMSMLDTLFEKFPTTFNKELAKELGIGWRSLVRKARELGIEKEEGFLDTRREAITKMAVANNHNPNLGKKGWSVPGGEKHRFKPGNISAMSVNADVVKRVHASRNATIKSERFRIKFGLPQRTRLKLNGYGQNKNKTQPVGMDHAGGNCAQGQRRSSGGTG